MIHVEPAPEPQGFQKNVREPGLDAIAELVGEEPGHKRRGPRRKKVAETRDRIPSAEFPPLWRKALPDLLTSYRRICAYLCLYIHHGTGAASVDHMVTRSSAWDQVYEWSNYRLACGLMNSRKGEAQYILDPFSIGDKWFGLEFVGNQVVPREGLDATVHQRVEETIDRLRLNDEECRLAREEYVDGYRDGDLDLPDLEKKAPFIARELARQGLLRPDEMVSS